MNELQIFENSEFGAIRTVMKDNEPWFVASDICKALDLSNPSMAVSRLDDDERAKFNLGVHDSDGTNCVNEYGLYSLVLASRKKEAKEFKRWITHEVIPSIRKNGGYIANQEQMTPEQIVANALIVAQNIISQKDNQIKELETSVQQMDAVITEMTPKVDYADRILSSNECMTVSQIAQDYGMSAKTFNKVLQKAGIQHKIGEQWILYAKHQGKGYVRTRTHDFTKPNGNVGTKSLTVWTQKGRMFLYEKLKEIGVFPEMELENA